MTRFHMHVTWTIDTLKLLQQSILKILFNCMCIKLRKVKQSEGNKPISVLSRDVGKLAI